MQNHCKEIACFSVSLLTDYTREKGLPTDKLFDGIEESHEILNNTLEWTDAKNWNKFAENFESTFGNKSNILYEAGIEIMEKQISNFHLLFLKIAPLPLIISNMGQYMTQNINKTLSLKVKPIKDGVLDLLFTPTDLSKYSKQICDFNRGCTYAALKLKKFKNSTLDELSCAAHGSSPYCHYRLKWTPRPNFIHQIKNFFLFRFRDQRSIIHHMEESYKNIQKQNDEILSLKDFLSHIMDTMAEGILWLEPDGKISFSNKRFSTITGYEYDEVTGKYFHEFLSSKNASSEYKEILKHCCAIPFVPESKEFNIITKDKKNRIVLTSFVWVPGEHRPPGFIISIHDITDQKKVEKKLSASENRYQSLYNNSPALIIGLDLKGYFIYANPTMEEQSGYTQEELRKIHFGQLIGPEADFDTQRLLKDLDTGIRLKEVHYKTKSGSWKSVVLNTYPMYDDSDNVNGIAGIGVDITETKLLNEQLQQTQRMDILGKMAGGLAHDFNNLLNVIMGFAQLIQKKSSENMTIQYTKNICKASERAAGLIRNLLTFSRGDIVKKKTFNLNELLKEIQSLILPIIPHNIKIYTEIPEEMYPINGNAGKIHQCILNLCLNSRDAIGEKNGSITLRLTDSPKDGFITIEVKDTGAGIPPDIIEHIFNPFFSTKEKKKGTGLGLSVVYGIVKSHGGEITLDSKPGEGTTFKIELPLKKDKTILKNKENREVSRDTDNSGVIMIVDDDELIRIYCREIIEKHTYTTVEFSDSDKALKWFTINSDRVFAVLSDIEIPKMDGVEMIRRFREIKKDLNVIWMTAYLSPDKRIPPEHDPILKKPFSPAELLTTINPSL